MLHSLKQNLIQKCHLSSAKADQNFNMSHKESLQKGVMELPPRRNENSSSHARAAKRRGLRSIMIPPGDVLGLKLLRASFER